MKNNDDMRATEERDPEVSAQYRALANETTPEKLDGIVLRTARKAVNSSSSARWGDNWFRPVTFVATLGLSIALLLEISDFQIFAPPPDLLIQQDHPPSASVFQDAADNAAKSVREVGATADESLQLSNGNAGKPEAIPIPLPAGAANDGQHCSDEQLASAEMWWHCIQELRESGLQAAAESELANLREAFPQYMPAK